LDRLTGTIRAGKQCKEMRGMAEPIVWQLSADNSDVAGAVLARSFMDEPVLLAAFNDLELLERYLPLRFAASVRFCCKFGEAWAVGTTPGEIAGVAVWALQPSPQRTPELSVELGFPPPDPEADAAWACLNEFADHAEAVFAELAPGWRELWMIGVEPGKQGMGLGGILLRKVLDDAVAAGVPVGLFTDRSVNVPFYERAEMELVWSGTSENGAVPLWTFRSPMPASS
jgi:GNAT superfamily N-acetyltransferase